MKGGRNEVRRLSVGFCASQEPSVVAQRLKYKTLIALSRGMKKALRKGFPERPEHWTPGNMFVAENQDAVEVELETALDEDDREVVVASTVTVDFAKLCCAKGTLREPKVTAAYDAESRTLTLTYTPNGAEFWGRDDDVVYVAVVEETTSVGFLVKLGARGDGGMQSVELPEEWEADKVHAYAFATTAKGKEASNSKLLTIA